MKRLLIFVDWFVPGYKAGGQIRSCANLAYALKDEMDIYVVTSDRDLGDQEPYESVTNDEWQVLDNRLQVRYLSPGNRGLKSIRSIIRSVKPDCIYLNSMFSYNFTLLPIEVSRHENVKGKIVLAPRGMLHKGALQYKTIKKKIFFRAFKLIGVHKKIVFHATDVTEHADIKNIFGKNSSIAYVPDFPSLKQNALALIEKKSGFLKLLFIARICATKNLLFIIALLRNIKAQLLLTIVGPVEDEAYWRQCLDEMASLPSNIKHEYLGAIPNQELPSIYKNSHLFILPTHGENFGHVIFESLLNGRPVLISDLTPWKNIEAHKVGWDVALSEKQLYLDRLEEAAGWGQDQFNEYCEASWQFAHRYNKDSNLKNEYLELFSRA